MNSQIPWLHRAVICLLGLSIATDLVLFGYLRMIYRGDNPALFYRIPVATSRPPDGFSSQGDQVSIPDRRSAGWAVRYTAPSCEFCQADESLWRPLKSRLKTRGYDVIVVVPTAKDSYPAGSDELFGAVQEAYVSTSWVRQFRLTATPTLLIFDSRGKLIWLRQGMLASGDPTSVMRAVASSMK